MNLLVHVPIQQQWLVRSTLLWRSANVVDYILIFKQFILNVAQSQILGFPAISWLLQWLEDFLAGLRDSHRMTFRRWRISAMISRNRRRSYQSFLKRIVVWWSLSLKERVHRRVNLREMLPSEVNKRKIWFVPLTPNVRSNRVTFFNYEMHALSGGDATNYLGFIALCHHHWFAATKHASPKGLFGK